MISLTKILPLPGILDGKEARLVFVFLWLSAYAQKKAIWVLGAVKCSLAFIYNVLEHDVPLEVLCRRESPKPRISRAASRPPASTAQPRVGAHSHFNFMSLQLPFNRPNSANNKQIHPGPETAPPPGCTLKQGYYIGPRAWWWFHIVQVSVDLSVPTQNLWVPTQFLLRILKGRGLCYLSWLFCTSGEHHLGGTLFHYLKLWFSINITPSIIYLYLFV